MEELTYKFKGHGSFYIRKGWLYKGLKNIELNPSVFTDKTINTSDTFGLGVAMVKALRYWLQAVGLTREVKGKVSKQEFTELGEKIDKYDKYIEEIGTLCLLHYRLATNKELATSWHYFFNEFNMNEFTKEDFRDSLMTHLKFQQYEVADGSIEDDFNCILSTYLPKDSTDPEDNMECPFSELGLIEVKNKKAYSKKAPKIDLIPPQILLAMIVEQHPEETEIRLADLLNEKNNIGKIFNLDFITLSAYLDNLQKTGLIQVVRTAGLDVIKIINKKDFIDYVVDYYESIKN